MLLRALTFLRCPSCLTPLTPRQVFSEKVLPMPVGAPVGACALHGGQTKGEEPCADCWTREIDLGVLACAGGHFFPVVRGVPRMEAGALHRFAGELPLAGMDPEIRKAISYSSEKRSSENGSTNGHATSGHDASFAATRESFSLEWDLWEPGDKTWIWSLEERKQVFAGDIDLPTLDRSHSRVVLDAGCGNGQLAAGMATLGFEVCAMDLSGSIERAHALKNEVAKERAPFVHYIQANVTRPPFSRDTFDIVYSAGVLLCAPDTHQAFDQIIPLTKAGGRAYVWLYSAKRKPIKRFISKSIRHATIRMPPKLLRRLCEIAAPPVNGVTSVLTKLGVRETVPRSDREMAVSLFDEFSPQFTHHHDEDEVAEWYKSLGFSNLHVCSVDRNGFGMRAERLS